MDSDRLTKLIYRKLDGDLGREEARELEDALARDPEAARLARECGMIGREMESDLQQSAGVDLKQDILKKINMETYTSHDRGRVILAKNIWSGPVVRYGLAFVLGVFTGFLVFTFLKPELTKKAGTEGMQGTFLNSGGFDDMKNADVLQFTSPGASVNCQVRYSTRIVEMRLELSSLEQVRATFEFNFNALQVLNVNNISVNERTTSTATGNFIQISNIGNNKFIIQLANKHSLPQDIDFKLYQGDIPIYQNAVQVNKE